MWFSAFPHYYIKGLNTFIAPFKENQYRLFARTVCFPSTKFLFLINHCDLTIYIFSPINCFHFSLTSSQFFQSLCLQVCLCLLISLTHKPIHTHKDMHRHAYTQTHHIHSPGVSILMFVC